MDLLEKDTWISKMDYRVVKPLSQYYTSTHHKINYSGNILFVLHALRKKIIKIFFPDNLNTRSVEISPLLPFAMVLVIVTLMFILIIFRRWPGLVAGIVAGCLTSVSIYLLLLTLKDQKLVYE